MILHYIEQFLAELYSLLLAMAPYLLLGFLFAGILKVWFPQKWINRYMGKSNWGSSINTALLGIPLPLCSCGVIPTGISFYRNGASKGSSVSFLISTPQTGVDSILVTYSLLGLPFAIIRVLVAFITGILGGVVTNSIAKNDVVDEGLSSNSCRTSQPAGKSYKEVFRYGFFEFLMDIAKWLIIGILIAAFLAVLIPDDFFTQYLTNEPLSLLVVLLASTPLYLCATASVPIAAILMLKGLSPGAALVLLMAGPATNAATITVIKKVFGNKTLLSYLGSIIAGALLFGYLINFLPRDWFLLDTSHLHELHRHELLPYWFQLASATILVSLVINGYFRRWRTNRKVIKIPGQTSILATSNARTPISKTPDFTFVAPSNHSVLKMRVEGMTCNHCKKSIETNLMTQKGVEKVTANPSLNLVIVEGTGFNKDQLIRTINSLGFSYVKDVAMQ
jgi:uncharacterized membrane protein YraQ (UPF0718 family)/copper chaperone CopZ